MAGDDGRLQPMKPPSQATATTTAVKTLSDQFNSDLIVKIISDAVSGIELRNCHGHEKIVAGRIRNVD